MENHKYDFDIMNTRTGKIQRKSFWGSGKDENECRMNARNQAIAYANKLTDETYKRACKKETSGCLPSKSSYKFQVTSCQLWM